MEELGEMVKRLRTELEMTLAEVATRIGSSTSYLCDVENGRRGLSMEKLTRFAELVKAPLEELVAAALRRGASAEIPIDVRDEDQALAAAMVMVNWERLRPDVRAHIGAVARSGEVPV